MNEDFNKYGYTITEPNDDVTAATIEKTGITATFNIAQMRSTRARVQKSITELNGTLKLETDKAANIKEHHPFVADLSMEDLFAAKLYYESMALVNGLPPKIKEMQEAVDESIKEEAHIITTLGLVEVAPQPEEPAAPAAPVAEAAPENGNEKA